MPQVAIIVPVCNAEDYIIKCMDSLQNQTFSDIKIICVENGSTDQSWQKIISRKNDKRVLAMRTPEPNVSHARNLGLFWALKTAPYVMFCDADDTYEKSMVETMVSKIQESGADLACCEIAVEYLTDYSLKQSDDDYYRLDFEGYNDQIKNIINSIDYSLCNKIFRSQIIRDYSITFPVKFHYEDACFCWKYLAASSSIFFIKEKLYNYLRHDNSIMNKTFAKENRSFDHIRIAEDIYDFLCQNQLLSSLKEEFSQFYTTYLDLAWKYSDESSIKYIKFLDKEFKKKFFG